MAHLMQQQQNQQHSPCQAVHSCVQVRQDNHQGIQKLFKQEQEFELLLMMYNKSHQSGLNPGKYTK